MTYRVQLKFTKYQNNNVNFYYPNDSSDETVNFRSHWQANYKATGKILSVVDELSENNFVLTRTFTWTDKQAFDEASQDPIVLANWAKRDKHHYDNQISTETKFLD